MSSTARETFVATRKGRWDRLDALLRSPAWTTAAEWAEIASLYRSLCADVARAESLSLGEDVRAYLDELASRAHNRLYGARQPVGLRLVEFVASELPREVRAQARYVLLAMALFYGPMALGGGGSLVDPTFAARVLPPEQLQQMEEMYQESDPTRESGGDAQMAGFYVMNNVGIAFRCFSTGALFGLGAMFYLVYNGLVLGTIAGYLASAGLGVNLLNYVAGHSAWELTGVCVSGAAGLRLGWAMIATEGRTRAGSLRRAAPSLFRLVSCSAVLLLVAASIEGFWSAGPMPGPVKWAFGLAQCAIVAGWLLLGGRRAPPAADGRPA